jgi:hypothetical protein
VRPPPTVALRGEAKRRFAPTEREIDDFTVVSQVAVLRTLAFTNTRVAARGILVISAP